QTTMKDGKVISAPNNAFNEVLPSFARNCAEYNHLREMVVTHTGLEVGSITELSYKLTSSDEYLPFMDDVIRLKEDSPVKEYIISVKIPIEKELLYQLLNDTIQPEIKEGDNWKEYIWTFHNVEPYYREIASNNKIPELWFTSSTGLEETNQFIAQQGIFDDELPDDLQKLIEQTIKNEKDTLLKAIALQDIVVNEVNLHPIPIEQTALRVRKPSEVWKSNSGTELEKTILLSRILSTAGISNTIVSKIYAEKTSVVELGCSKLYTDLYLAIHLPDKKDITPYLSATYKNEPITGYSSNEAFCSLFDGKESNIAIVLSPNLITAEGELDISPERINGKIHSKFTMSLNPYAAIKKDKSGINAYFDGVEKSVNVSCNKGFSEADFELSASQLIKEQAGYLFVSIPKASKAIDSWHLESNLVSERKTDISLPFQVEEDYYYKFSIPAGMELAMKDTIINIENTAGKLIFKLEKTENGFSYRSNIKLENTEIAKENYSDFKKLMQTWYHPQFNEIVLRPEDD
ncbi:MAG: hypothetical protein C0594_05890, partial [Marinilabiliales bacterium]